LLLFFKKEVLSYFFCIHATAMPQARISIDLTPIDLPSSSKNLAASSGFRKIRA
jgi:hypothetical protein